MNGKRVLGMLVVTAMIVTAMPVLAGHAKAQGVDTSKPPSYLVIVRTPYDQQPLPKPNRVGNAYQDDKFGVEIVAYVTGYDYDSSDSDTIKLYPAAVAVRGSNAGLYKIKWLELDATKFSFESKSSSATPYATDYESSLNDMHNGFMEYNLSQDSTDYVIENWINVAADIGGAAFGEAASVVASEGGGPLASLVAGSFANSAVHYLISSTLHKFFNVENVGFVYGGSGENPWKSDSTQGHTYMAARGTASGNNDHKNAIIAGAMEWQLDDGVNDRIHVLTIKATLCYGAYLWTGWYAEHQISTSVTIYVVPQSMVGSTTRGADDISRYDSDPANYNSYYLKLTINANDGTYSSTMLSQTPHTDSGDGRTIFLMTGQYHRGEPYNQNTGSYPTVINRYFYYRGALPVGDNEDKYKMRFIKDDDYQTNMAKMWIFTSGDIRVTIEFNGHTYSYTMKGGTSRLFYYDIQYSGSAYITIKKLDSDSSVGYWISGYGYYYNHNSDSSGSSSSGGSSSGGSNGGSGGGDGGGGNHNTIIPRSVPPSSGHQDDTAPCTP